MAANTATGLTLAELIATAELPCADCAGCSNGPGWVYSNDWAEFNAATDALEEKLRAARLAHGLHPHQQLTGHYGPHDDGVAVPSDIADLEREERELLDGMPTSPEFEPCIECDGTGFVLTEGGKALRGFMRRHGGK